MSGIALEQASKNFSSWGYEQAATCKHQSGVCRLIPSSSAHFTYAEWADHPLMPYGSRSKSMGGEEALENFFCQVRPPGDA